MAKAEAAANGNDLDLDLIVDFSNRSRRSDTDSNCKQVRFSEDIATHCFQYPSRKEVFKRWHSKRDKSFFTREMERDVRSIRYLLSISPMEELGEESLYGCIRLEAHVSSKVAKFLKDKKQGHARSIVEMQDYLSDEQLAAYAMIGSSQSRERAQELAAGYWAILS